MSTEDSEHQPEATAEAAPKIPDYLTSPNAVFKDEDVQWRYGRAPDYTKTRKVWAEGKKMNHAPGSLEEMVENLVKNWEIEASFKPRLSDWRTIDHEKYSFALGGGPPQSAEHMIKVGTYNALIPPNEFYSPENSDFASSHKTFKRMMPTFAWEVVEVYSGPPRVSFRWRHWGIMKNDYVGFNDKGEKITAKAHGGQIDIEGVIVAQVNDKLQIQALQTWMDPLEMFRQIAPHGIVNKQTMNRSIDPADALDEGSDAPTSCASQADIKGEKSEHESEAPSDASSRQDTQAKDLPVIVSAYEQKGGATVTQHDDTPYLTQTNLQPEPQSEAQAIVETAAAQGDERETVVVPSNAKETTEAVPPVESISSDTSEEEKVPTEAPRSMYSSSVNGYEQEILEPARRGEKLDESKVAGVHDGVDEQLERSSDQVHPHVKDVEHDVQPQPGAAVAAEANSHETEMTHEEMSRMAAGECPFLMNRE